MSDCCDDFTRSHLLRASVARGCRAAGDRSGHADARRAGRVPGGVAPPAAGAAPGPVGAGAGVPTGTGAPPAVPGGPSPGVASSVGAEAFDFAMFVLRLTRTAVPAGDLTIYFRNHDVGEHDLWLGAPPSVGAAPLMISEAVGENGGATKTVAGRPAPGGCTARCWVTTR